MCGKFNHDAEGNHVNNVGTPLPEGTTEKDAHSFDVTEEFEKLKAPAEVPAEAEA